MLEHLTKIGLFLIKSIVFSLVFGGVWMYVVRPITTSQSSNSVVSSQAASQVDQEAAMKKYLAQAAKADEQLRRMDAILSKKEEQDRRFDALLSTWEKQSKGNK